MEQLYKEYRNIAEIYIVYTREAHPEDGRQSRSNIRDKVIYNTPKSLADRAKIATDCIKGLKLSIPCLLDDMKDTVNKVYTSSPSRACLIGKDGKFVYVSQAGPHGVKPAEIVQALKKLKAGE